MAPGLIRFSQFSALFCAYYLTARFGLSLDAVSGFATLIWPPSGLALAAAILWGPEVLPAVFLAAFVVNWQTGAPWFSALGIACGNTLEPFVGAFILARWASFDARVGRLRDVLWLLVGAAAGSTAISATVGVSSLAIGGVVSQAAFASTWTAWWVGDMLGVLVVAPLVLTWVSSSIRQNFRWSHVLEATAGLAILVAICEIVFPNSAGTGGPVTNGPTAFLFFPLVIWSAIRLGQMGGTLTTFFIATVAVWGTYQGRGPFISVDISTSLLILQLFMGVLTTTSLVVGAVATESRLHLRKLQAAVQAREDFLAMASHDLKNPLSSILLATDLSERSPSPSHIAMIRRSAQQMLTLIHDFLAVNKIESGLLVLEKKPYACAELLDEACGPLRSLAESKSITLEWTAANIGRPVACDKEQILRVFSNLVGNAIKFTAKEGIIRVTAQPEAEYVRFTVADNGSGISAEELPHIFDRYWQARKTAKSGSGLGLFIAKGIVESHGGQLWAESVPGKGSTFHFTVKFASQGTRA